MPAAPEIQRQFCVWPPHTTCSPFFIIHSLFHASFPISPNEANFHMTQIPTDKVQLQKKEINNTCRKQRICQSIDLNSETLTIIFLIQ